MNERLKKISEYSLLWDAMWQGVASDEGWDENTDPNEHIYWFIEPYGYDNDKIDAVMFFADGTIEFHLKKEKDAYNWSTFPLMVIEDILQIIE